MKSEFENWFLSTPTGKALCTPNLGYYIFERKFDEYFDRDVEMAHRAWQHQQSKVDELQKRVDQQGLIIANVMSIASDLQKNWEMFEIGKKLEQALKGGSTTNLNTDENGECRHFSTTLFQDGKAECFHCDAVVNEQREVIGNQSQGLHPFFKKVLP